LVPATPDEQLRLEEAQSLKQKTGESLADAGLPSSNVVIEESVGPGADKDEMDIDKEPAVQPAESEIPDGMVSLSPTEHLLKGAESTGDSFETPNKKFVTIPSTHPSSTQPERMTTRVSSGAIRHKSVSEILGETPKSLTHDRSHGDETPDSVARMRFKDRKEREKERTRLSTVVFPKQTPTQQDKADSLDLINRDCSDAVSKVNEEQDYLFTLFLNRAYAPPRGSHLNTLLTSAHKTLSTSNHLLEYQEQMDCRTLRRIYALQNANRWPLRQMKRSLEPPRQGSHWDVLIDHMKWMRTDFREERKWKIAAAKSCADWCAEYVSSDEEHRALLRVHAKNPTPTTATQENSKSAASPSEDTGDEAVAASHPTPDLVPSAEEESVSDGFNEEPRHDLCDTVAPAAIFSLGSDEFNFSIDMTPAAEKLLDELPLYEPVRIAPETQLPTFKQPPDSVWKTELLPVSKFASTKITFHDDERPRKRSRYDYTQYTSDLDHRITEILPEQNNVALFRPENKHIRDRIHPGHSFRPPTEHPMPSVGFFESRQSSQWTMAEDDELRRLVKEYSYNWSLISSCLTSPSLFTSGAERRTPWECFERWVGLEGLPADMSKTQYFRAYHQRLETAQRTVLAQQQAAQQQQQQAANNGQVQQPIRRRTTQPLRVDRRRSSRHLALLDAMRKLAKKRETMLQKQQHASHLASLRKANEANQPKPPISSPAEFSRLKHEREQKLQERQEQYRQQMIAQQRANLNAQRAGQMSNQKQSQPQPQQQMMNAQGLTPNNMPPNSANGAIPNGTPNGGANGMQAGVGVNQNRAQPIQGLPAGATPVNGPMQNNAMAMKIMPHGQMQQGIGARPAVPMQTSPENDRIVREATRLQEQQRALQTRQQTQVPQQPGQPQQAQQFHNQQFTQGSPNLNLQNGPNNPAMIAAMQAQGGMQSPSFHGGTPQGVSTPSPRVAQPNPLSSGVVPTISTYQNQIQQANPSLPLEQVNKMATDRLNAYRQQRSISQQAAMNAAAGGMNNVQANYQVPHDGSFQTPPQPGVPNGNPAMQVPQNQGFSPMMRVPQANQQTRVNVTSSPAMNGAVPQTSRSATPQTQRSGSAQAGAIQGSSKSPHPPAAQTARS
jgi:chromatin modification-related protein VID21